MRRIVVGLVGLLDVLSGVGLFLMVGIILLQVVLRYGFSDGVIWGEEFARIMMIGAALFGAAVAHWQGKHIRFDLLEQVLSPRARRVMAITSELAVLCTVIVLTYSGWHLAVENEMQDSLTLDISMLYVYALVPIGFASMAAASLRHLFVMIFDPPEVSDGPTGYSM